VARVEGLGYSGQDVRRSTPEMLHESATRLGMAQSACEALSYRLESGNQSVLVAGSVARGEATKGWDIDLNLLVTQEFGAGL
jgi:predicted nucleotidyltransferase